MNHHGSLLTKSICVCAVVSMLMAVTHAANDDGAKEVNYFILIDAGSSGSRIHVHPYRDNGAGVPQIQASFSLKEKPGLSAYATIPAKAGESLVPLLDFAKQQIPMSKWKSTPVHLQATAGLRSVLPDQADRVLESCRDRIAVYPFHFQRHWARIITGTQEGLNGWLATNYLKGVFDELSRANASGKNSISTFGVIEMGGASMQLTFVPDDLTRVGVDREHLNPITIADHTFYVYSHSYLDYGLEAAQTLFSKKHMELIETDGNPCYPRNGRHSAIGDYAKCAEMVEMLLDKEQKCPEVLPCSFNGVHQPPIGNEYFYAIENFYYTTSFFGVHEQRNFIPALKEAGTTFCSKDWKELPSLYPKETTSDLSKYCFSAAYIPKVIEAGFGFHVPERNIEIVRSVNGVPIDWALGAVLYEILQQQQGQSDSQVSTLVSTSNHSIVGPEPTLGPAGYLLCLVFVMVSACVVYRRICRRSLGKNRPPLSSLYFVD